MIPMALNQGTNAVLARDRLLLLSDISCDPNGSIEFFE